MIINSPYISGSLTVTGNIIASGSITLSGSIASSSYAANADLLDGLDATVFTLTSSFIAQTASFTAFTSSLNSFSSSVNSFSASQNLFTSSLNSFSASVLTYTSSLNNKTSSFATTGSNTFEGIQTINSNLIVTGSITAQTLVVQTITSSIDFVTGSTRFGSILANTHVFTGSVSMNPGGLFVSSSGFVGIGTTTDAGYKLDVNGTGRFSGDLYVNGTNKNVQLGSLTLPTTSNNLRHYFAGSATFAGQDGVGEANVGNNFYFNGGFLRRDTDAVSNIRFNAGLIYLQVAASGAANSAITWTNALTIANSGAATFSSSVDATVANLSSGLKVTGSSLTTGTGAEIVFSSGKGLFLTFNRGTSTYLPTEIDGSTVTLSISGTPKLTIASTGAATFSGEVNVTSGLLSMSGSGGNPPTSGVGLRFVSNRLLIYGGSTDITFQKNSNASANMIILESGDVGIGTASPTAKLDVNGEIRMTGSTLFRGMSSNTLQLCGGTSSSNVLIDGSVEVITMSTNGGERMRITSGGYLLLGTTTATYGQAGRGTFEMNGSTDNIFVQKVAGSLANYLYSDATKSELYSTNFLQISVNGAERMRITSGGNVLIGTTTAGTDFTRTACSTSTQNVMGLVSTDDSSGAGFIAFRKSTTGNIGSISRVGTTDAVSFNTTSDYRLKEDLKDIKGLQKVCAIKVYDFKWKDNEFRMDGVLAHELAEIIPFAVHGEKDAEEMQSVDYSKIVPVLVKSIQELNTKLDAANVEIEALKAK